MTKNFIYDCGGEVYSSFPEMINEIQFWGGAVPPSRGKRGEGVVTAKEKTALRKASPYNASITREQFLFYEMRTTAKLVCEGLGKKEIVERIMSENLFQYPTERSIKSIANACIRRLDALQDSTLVKAIAEEPSDVAKQVCLYAMMRQYRLVWDFMITVVGAKYRNLDFSFGKIDLNEFFTGLQEQDAWVATWSASTNTKLMQVLKRILAENEYLTSSRGRKLQPVLISPLLENAIRDDGQSMALVAFNCLD